MGGSGSDQRADIVIGAGMGGLCAAIALACGGRRVVVLEQAAQAGGKMRALPSAIGPVDTGPTVLTLRDVFDGLFARAGARLADYVTLVPQPILARHFWPDGSQLDLGCDPAANAQAIGALAGTKAAAEYLRFDQRTRQMYAAFDAPMMRAPRPRLGALAWAAVRRPAIWPALLPGLSLHRWLAGQFSDPRLVQLFGRYATYVGGAPQRSPAVLALIWQAEAQGVWAVQGGMAALAGALHRLACDLGVQFRFGCAAQRIVTRAGRAAAVITQDGREMAARSVVFNGDPAALAAGLLGPGVKAALPAHASQPRSLSAYVWAFAAQLGPDAPDLAHHNVFFAAPPATEFAAIARGDMAADPSLYICAQDRPLAPAPQDAPAPGTTTPPERFEIIMNASAQHPHSPHIPHEAALCQTRVFAPLARYGLTFSPAPQPAQALTTPQALARLYPGSMGAIYGRSPQSLLAPLLRPRAQTQVPGLYLAGGGAHPGPGVPMAALSGLHAAEAILNARTLTFAPPQVAMPGGISTG